MTLAIQQALRNGSTLESLQQDLYLNVYKHPTEPLVGFKYNQIDSPKLHPIVREARGVVLELGTWNLVAKAFNRFFNVGENQEEFATFNWSNFSCNSKEDGSLLLLYYYNGSWRVNTSGSFADGLVQGYSIIWKDLFWTTSGLHVSDLSGLETKTLVFELCTPYNKIVRRYPRSCVYLLAAFECSADSVSELSDDEVENLHKRFINRNVKLPKRYAFDSKEKITEFLLDMEAEDKTFEGVIIRDNTNQRYKWKTKTYVALHSLKDNGNILLPKRVVPIVLSGEVDEIIAILPETRTAMLSAKKTLDDMYNEVLALWNRSKSASSQKDYALLVKGHLLNSILFSMRKLYPDGGEKELRQLWRQSDELLSKRVFENVSLTFDELEEENLESKAGQAPAPHC